jgi:hypothetical protein
VKSLAHEVLFRAVEKLGARAVAARLDISPASLKKLLDGESPVSDTVLLQVIDLVMDGEPKH